MGPRGGSASPATDCQAVPQKAASDRTPSSAVGELPVTLRNDILVCDGCKRHRADSITVSLVPRENEHIFTDYWPFAYHL